MMRLIKRFNILIIYLFYFEFNNRYKRHTNEKKHLPIQKNLKNIKVYILLIIGIKDL